MEIKRFVCNIFDENTYVIWDAASREAAIIDPGMADTSEEKAIDSFIADNRLKIKYILLTHAHLDHTFGAAHAKEVYGTEILGHNGDGELARNLDGQARMFHLPYRLKPLEIDRYLADNERIALGAEELVAMNLPGHSEGSLAYYAPQSDFVLTGDVLFNNGVGRTDLPGGSSQKLFSSIMTRLFTLPDSTTVFAGHGAPTTIGAEKARF